MKEFAGKIWKQFVEKLGPKPEENQKFLKAIKARRTRSKEWRRHVIEPLDGSLDFSNLDRATLRNVRPQINRIVLSDSFPMMGGKKLAGAFPNILMNSSQKRPADEAVEHIEKTLEAILRLCLGPGDSGERLDQFNANETIVWAYEHGHDYPDSKARAASCVIPTALLSMTDPQHEFVVRVSDSLAEYESWGGVIPTAPQYLDGACYQNIRNWAAELLEYLPIPKEEGLLGVYCLLMINASRSD